MAVVKKTCCGVALNQLSEMPLRVSAAAAGASKPTNLVLQFATRRGQVQERDRPPGLTGKNRSLEAFIDSLIHACNYCTESSGREFITLGPRTVSSGSEVSAHEVEQSCSDRRHVKCYRRVVFPPRIAEEPRRRLPLRRTEPP